MVSPKERHRPDDVLGALAHKPLLLERVAWAEAACPKRDHPEQRVVVIAINPNLIGEGCRHSATTTASMAAIAVVRSVYLETFLGDAGEVRVWAFQLTFGVLTARSNGVMDSSALASPQPVNGRGSDP